MPIMQASTFRSALLHRGRHSDASSLLTTLLSGLGRSACQSNPVALRKYALFSAMSIHYQVQRREKILVTGAAGQVGRELIPHLRTKYGEENVIASDIRKPEGNSFVGLSSSGLFLRLDVLDPVKISEIVRAEGVGTIVHLAAILSAVGEKKPLLALKINNEGIQNVLEVARNHGLKVFCPSTIAVFGPSTPKRFAPDDCIMRPTTMYGLTKMHTELLGEYYHDKFGVDFRSLRYPGVISANAKPGGGTTDYAVDIYRQATLCGVYTCYLKPNTALPMIYMPDLLKATTHLIATDKEKLNRRTYNIGAMTFTPQEIGRSIQNILPHFQIGYEPDFRQSIAESWPESIDYTCASSDWGWNPDYDLDRMTQDILGIRTDDGHFVREEELGPGDMMFGVRA